LEVPASWLPTVSAAGPHRTTPPGHQGLPRAARHRTLLDTGKLPATADDDPPGSEPGLVKVSAPEARRLAHLATQPMTTAARQLGYAWSRWRRRHQARGRWHHNHAQLKAAQAT